MRYHTYVCLYSVYGHIHKVLYDRRVGKGTVITIKGICREGDAYKTVGDTSDSISPHKKDGEASVLLLFFFFLLPLSLILFCWQKGVRRSSNEKSGGRSVEDNTTPSAWVAPELVNCGDSFIIVSQSLSIGDSAALRCCVIRLMARLSCRCAGYMLLVVGWLAVSFQCRYRCNNGRFCVVI